MESTPGFVRTSHAWYAASALQGSAERVCITKYLGAQPATTGELVLEWRTLADRPELRVEQAGWQLLAKDFSGLLRHLTRVEGPLAPDDVCALLLRLGFADMTEPEKPANVERFRRLR